MERFVKEYASYIIKNAKAYKDTEKIAKVEKICKMTCVFDYCETCETLELNGVVG